MSQSASALEIYKADATARAIVWGRLSDEGLRREAVRAAQARDATALWELTDAYLTLHGSAGAHVSKHTRRSYQRGVHDLIQAWAGESLLRPSRDAADIWLRQLEASGKTAGTIRVRLAAAKLLYKALRWAGATDAAPFSDAKPAKDKTAPWDKRQPYSHEAVEKLLAVAGPVDRVLVLLGAHAGLRVSEAVALRWDDIDLGEQRLAVRQGKGGKRRQVIMSHTLIEALEGVPPKGEWVLPFTTANRARQRLENLCKRAGVKYLGIHALRHYFGTRYVGETGDLHGAARLMGHSSSVMAEIYAKWNDRRPRTVLGGW